MGKCPIAPLYLSSHKCPVRVYFLNCLLAKDGDLMDSDLSLPPLEVNLPFDCLLFNFRIVCQGGPSSALFSPTMISHPVDLKPPFPPFRDVYTSTSHASQ